ncbi:glycoside hydrolase domain-containing protein [Kitasatospora sp. NPDC006697]|uniref:glycoside hydrolase domain-containing protein n=1 Tax=Kitasatospora sp. NPDC006697 TaxID=3364020 RepID=UPI00369E7482
MVRYLRTTALGAAALVLLLATDATGGQGRVPSAVRLLATPVGATVPPAAVRAPAPLPPTVLADPGQARLAAVPRTVFTGSGFDACSAPGLDAMRAWRGASPYGVVGIYTSGSQRACAQTRLTRDWVSQVRSLGWRLLPTHVGRQAPCAALPAKPVRIDPAQAVQQGRAEAAEAVHAARTLGLDTGTPIYLDMEAYQPGNAPCAKAVVDFTLGWTQGLHKAGYFAGYYSSLDSGITDLVAAARAGAAPMPDAIWYARWDGRNSTDGAGVLGADQWTPHRRVHQQRGSAKESYGGVELEVDRDQVDSLVG